MKEVQQIVDEKLSEFGIDKKIVIDNDIYYTLVSYYNLNDYTPPTRHDEETMLGWISDGLNDHEVSSSVCGIMGIDDIMKWTDEEKKTQRKQSSNTLRV